MFLQQWRYLASISPLQVPKKKMEFFFIKNLHQKVVIHLQLQCVNKFDEVIKKGLTIEFLYL